MNKKTSGFTIVELLIVIVVVGILAAIVIVAYSGVQNKANNATRYNELKAWSKQFEMYRAQEGVYPAMADGGYCLGSGFPVGAGGVARCRDYQVYSTGYLESDNSALMTELRKVGTLPGGPRLPVGGTVGPYVAYNAAYLQFTMVINGAPSDCPADVSFTWTNGAGLTLCSMRSTR